LSFFVLSTKGAALFAAGAFCVVEVAEAFAGAAGVWAKALPARIIPVARRVTAEVTLIFIPESEHKLGCEANRSSTN
jgi:hypothetical protein